MSLVSFFANLGFWNWLILGLLLYGLEGVVPGVYFVWFGTAAMITGGIVYATGISWPWQLVIFAALSVVTVFTMRQYARPSRYRSDQPDLNVRGAQYVGREFTVAEAIRGGRGKVRVHDTLWLAEGDDAPVGARVRVKGVKDNVLLVERDKT